MTQTWLKNASISVSPPPKLNAGRFLFRRDGRLHTPDAKFLANLRFSNGWECQAYDEIGACRAPEDQHPPYWPFFR